MLFPGLIPVSLILRLPESAFHSSMAFLGSIFLLLVSTSSFSGCCAESRKELRDKEFNNETITLAHSDRSNRIDPSRVVQLLWRPRAFLYSGFLSDDECEYLISLAHGAKERTDDPGVGGKNRQLASSETKFNPEDEILAMIEERISAWTFLPKENGNPLQVVRYGLEKAGKNLDYFGNKSTLSLSAPLMATVILYLSNVSRGGELLFPDAKVKSKIWSDCRKTGNIQRPVKGNAILFFNSHLNASPDESSKHGRCPVLEGDMWCASKIFYVKPVKEKLSFDSDGSECTDEDENCPQWAAVGECQRNPVFMVGSPDYYGTCRKSCNVC